MSPISTLFLKINLLYFCLYVFNENTFVNLQNFGSYVSRLILKWETFIVVDSHDNLSKKGVKFWTQNMFLSISIEFCSI